MYPEFKTSDIVLAATLNLNGFKLIRIDLEGNKGQFIFENVSVDVITKFDVRGMLVEPQDFNASIRSLTTAVKRQLNAAGIR